MDLDKEQKLIYLIYDSQGKLLTTSTEEILAKKCAARYSNLPWEGIIYIYEMSDGPPTLSLRYKEGRQVKYVLKEKGKEATA